MADYMETIKQLSRGDKHLESWLLLSRARYVVYRVRERELRRYNLSPENAQVLAILQSDTEVKSTQANLARLGLLKPHTMSAMLRRMEKKGLIKRQKDLERKNLIRVTLTEKGRKAYELTSKRGPIHRIMGTLNEKENEQFYRILNKILIKAGEELGLKRVRH
jgi:DNA-binding MarR family transcriptional regulator